MQHAHADALAASAATLRGARVAGVRDESDARRDARRTVVLTIAMYAVLAASEAGAVPPWMLIVAVPLVYVRLSLALHELLHARTAGKVTWFHRLAMIF